MRRGQFPDDTSGGCTSRSTGRRPWRAANRELDPELIAKQRKRPRSHDGFVKRLVLVGLRGFSGQALGSQSFVVSLQGFLRLLVFRNGLSLAGSLKRFPRLALA